MQRLYPMLVMAFIVVALPAAADECMDCGEKLTQRYTQSGAPVWPQQSSALCCDFPCDGEYELRDENVGWGCLTCNVNNELVVGTICCSSSADLGCQDTGGVGVAAAAGAGASTMTPDVIAMPAGHARPSVRPATESTAKGYTRSPKKLTCS